jgi:hypothetical protein
VKLAIMQPYLFPYIGYFQLLHAADRFVVYDDVGYIKQGWIHRNRILIGGAATFFVVPIRHASSRTAIRDTAIDHSAQNTTWRARLLKTFDNTYRRAPEFGRVFPLIESVLTAPVSGISDLALTSLRTVADYLEIAASWVISSAAHHDIALTGEARVLAICRAEGAREYLNLPGGEALYSRERFDAQGIALKFIRPRPVEYRQFGWPFVPNLSIIDVLMFNSRDAVRGYLDQYDLV